MVRSWVFWEVVVFGIPAVPSKRASCARCLCADRTPGTLPWCSCRLPCRLVGREDTVPPGTSLTPSMGSWYVPMEGGGRSGFQAPSAGVRAVHEVHFISALYKSAIRRRNLQWVFHRLGPRQIQPRHHSPGSTGACNWEQVFHVNHSCRLCDNHFCRSDSLSIRRFCAALVL